MESARDAFEYDKSQQLAKVEMMRRMVMRMVMMTMMMVMMMVMPMPMLVKSVHRC